MTNNSIKDKDTFKRLQSAGLVGNYFRMWDKVQGVRDAGYKGWLTVRSRVASDRALFIPAVRSERVWDYADQYLAIDEAPSIGGYSLHAQLKDVYLQECPSPDTGRVINLEAALGFNRACSARDALLYVRYALNDPTNLRHSLEQNGVDATGLKAWHVLQHYVGPHMGQLEDIWHHWPAAIIEASVFTKRVGVLDSPLLIWEAREF